MSNKNVKKSMYIRKGTYSAEQVYEVIKDHMFDKDTVRVNLDGDMIKANSQRYQLFFTKGFTCKCCGIKGKYFAKERFKSSKKEIYHLNLYAVDKNGSEILMTKDHIIPISKGGKSELDNYQTMCCICNSRKSNNTE